MMADRTMASPAMILLILIQMILQMEANGIKKNHVHKIRNNVLGNGSGLHAQTQEKNLAFMNTWMGIGKLLKMIVASRASVPLRQN